MTDDASGGVSLREWGDAGQPGILLWPGLGSTGTYFAAVAGMLPGRPVSVDPPGFGHSPPLDPCTFGRLVEVARALIGGRRCRAMVGHSLGAYVALGVGCHPPPDLRAIVLVDGGFMTGSDFAGFGMPVLSGRDELVAWLRSNELRFPDWGSAVQKLAQLISAEPTAEFETYVREVMVEVDGEVREAAPPERAADLMLAIVDQDVVAMGRGLEVPTLLIACGQPPERRAAKEKAWQAFVAASPQVELHVVDDWGHNPTWQAPEASTKLIADWLRKHI